MIILRVFRAWVITTFVVLGALVIATSGSNANANETAALLALCSAVLLFTAILSRVERNLAGAGAILSAIFAAAVAWFWLVSSQAPELSQLEIAGSLLLVIILTAVLGVIGAIVHYMFFPDY